MDKQFYIDAFKGYEVPEGLKNASIEICEQYDIKGICDPMYISNVIAKEVGIGNGMSQFNNEHPISSNFIDVASRIVFSYPIENNENNVENIESILYKNI